MDGHDLRIVATLLKSPTGIDGFDQITRGGLPTGRPTLVCGSAGCGKTLFAISFLVHGATKFDEPGVFMSFEESSDELAQNVASLGFDLPGLIEKKKIVLDAGNGTAGSVAPPLFERLGAEIVPLFCDHDGRFPNHHPDPTVASN